MKICSNIRLEYVDKRKTFGGIPETFVLLFLFKLKAGMVLKRIQNGLRLSKNGTKWSPPAIPIPGVSKCLLPGGKKLGVFYDSFTKKLKNQIFASKS